MKRFFLLLVFIGLSVAVLSAQDNKSYTISGSVLNKSTGKPVEYATVLLMSTEQWAVADAEGKFTIQNVQPGKNVISISCLGFVTDTKEIVVSKDIRNYTVSLAEDNLTLESVVVTAQDNSNSATTSRTIDRTALDHIQMVNVADVSSLLPGGATKSPDLLSDQVFNIRAGSSTEVGNSSFGTAVEVDGVRLSNNGSFAEFSTSGVSGAAVNNIASTNVESVEVITGVPSVEYGDMTSGVVKINTRKGRTPYIVTLSTNPNLKQVSASKGFGLGETRRGASKGILNASLEYTLATKDLRSPYESYDRKQIQLTYSNLFDRGILSETPLRFSVSASGNLGGMDNKADPDAFSENRTTVRDNSFRGNFSLDWLLSKKWITNLEFSGSVVYSDRLSREHENVNWSSDSPAVHGTEEGYFMAQYYDENPNAAVILRPSGYWYSTMCVDDRPINYSLKLKANWARQFGDINNKIKVGIDWSGDGNFGIGQYTENMSTAPDFWEYRYCDVPFMNNVAAYIEENITIPIGKTRLNLIAGLRNDNTIIKGSAYGTTSSLSPRFNLKYTILSPKDRWNKTVKELSFRASWGVATKLPSYSILYPEPSYQTINTFASTSTASGSAFYAYYIMPQAIEYNAGLRWQKNQQSEIGFDINVGDNRISLSAYYNRTLDAYRLDNGYDRFVYTYTPTSSIGTDFPIPAENRVFSVDRQTGQVTVSDITGTVASQVLESRQRRRLTRNTYADNSVNPITRYGLEWVVDFKRIRPINTTIRLDGSFYGYRTVDKNIVAYSPNNTTGSDGEYLQYIGYYVGGNDLSNGSETRQVSTNLTITTHIPKVRMILSLRLEATLLRYSRFLSEKDGGARSLRISDRNDILSITDGSIYDGNGYSVIFPEYYTTYGDPYTQRNYYEDLTWAKENDTALYNDLSRLAVASTSFDYYYNKDYITPYFSMNFSITKEIGDLASISFYANNFFNNFGQLRSTRDGNYVSASGYIPDFYYGLTLRFKF